MGPGDRLKARRPPWGRRLVAVALLICVLAGMWIARALTDSGERKGATHLPLPDRAALESAVALARGSTVKVEGLECDPGTAGSGVVVADQLVLTAAHVVAGSSEILVIDGSRGYRATPVLVDTRADLAVLYVSGLSNVPLGISQVPADRATIGVVLGFPKTRGFNISPAVVLDRYQADGHDIYGKQPIRREVLEVEAEILPGSSGGPLVDASGDLIGIVFGQSEEDPDVGYAVTVEAIAPAVEEGIRVTDTAVIPVPTGDCLASTSAP